MGKLNRAQLEPSRRRKVTALVGVGYKLTRADARNNFFFRQGDPEHMFEAGQDLLPDWRQRTEEEVLVQRVHDGKKPVSEIVMQPGDDFIDFFDSFDLTRFALVWTERRSSVVSSRAKRAGASGSVKPSSASKRLCTLLT